MSEKTSTSAFPNLVQAVNSCVIAQEAYFLIGGWYRKYTFDFAKISFNGAGLVLLSEAIDAEIRNVTFDAVGGIDTGTTPVVAAFTLWRYIQERPVRTFVVREVKRHGMKSDIEGRLPSPSSRVVIVDDVVESGESITKVVDALRSKGHEVVLVISILDCAIGGREALAKINVPYRPLVTVESVAG